MKTDDIIELKEQLIHDLTLIGINLIKVDFLKNTKLFTIYTDNSVLCNTHILALQKIKGFKLIAIRTENNKMIIVMKVVQ